jgi:hypothetical protein
MFWSTSRRTNKLIAPRNYLPLLLFALIAHCFLLTTAAQPPITEKTPESSAQDLIPLDVAPPPTRKMTDDEKRLIMAETSVKKRAEVYVELLNARLAKTEALTTTESYQDALIEIGGYRAVLEHAVEFLNKQMSDGKTLSALKKVEVALRGHLTRLETVRRDTPYKYAFHIQRLQKYIRAARAKATDAMFSDDVVKDRKTS